MREREEIEASKGAEAVQPKPGSKATSVGGAGLRRPPTEPTLKKKFQSVGQLKSRNSQYFPTAEGDRMQRPARPVRDSSVAYGDEKILVIEDSTALRELADLVLTGLGYGVLLAEDGPEAIELVEAGAKFDLLFTDIALPKGMDGVEVAGKLNQIKPGLKVLYTSGYPQESMAKLGLNSEAALLTKPYRRAQVAAMVRKVLDG